MSLEDIKRRTDAATLGPWHLFANRHPTTDGQPWGCIEVSPHPAGGAGKRLLRAGPFYQGEQERTDCEFIAHAREDVPWLLERIDELSDALAEALADLAIVQGGSDGE